MWTTLEFCCEAVCAYISTKHISQVLRPPVVCTVPVPSRDEALSVVESSLLLTLPQDEDQDPTRAVCALSLLKRSCEWVLRALRALDIPWLGQHLFPIPNDHDSILNTLCFSTISWPMISCKTGTSLKITC